MSSNWPDKPLIRILRGNIGYKDVSGRLALMTPTGNYRSCAASLPGTGPLEDPSIIPIARSVGLVAERIAHQGLLREALVDLGAYALAWAAEIIAQEETGEGEDR